MKRDTNNGKLKQIITKEFVQDLNQLHEDGLGKINETNALHELQEISLKNKVQLSEDEKGQLKQRIETSIQSQKSRSIVYMWGSAAAAIAVLVVSTILMNNMSSSGIIDYAKNFDNVSFDENTHLYLGMNDQIDINTDEAEIKHLENSTEICIDAENKVEQQLEINQVIYNTLLVPYGKKTKIVLSDNSTIWLNSGSKFIYPAQFSDKTREVFLEGEAVFDVAENKEKPFVVITNDIEVKVLGTVFNVSAYPSDEFTSTALERGAVEINFKRSFFQNETVNITPGTVAVFDKKNENITQSTEDVSKYTSWRYGIFILEEEPLQNITNKLSRFHNIKIDIEGDSLAKETFSGRLEFNQSVVHTLETIGAIVNFELFVDEHRITIREK